MFRRSFFALFTAPVSALLAAPQLSMREAEQRNAVYEQNHFLDCFNKLDVALVVFAEEYKASKGLVWPAKKAQAIYDAMRDLEKCSGFLVRRH